jgi:TolA-binding protein
LIRVRAGNRPYRALPERNYRVQEVGDAKMLMKRLIYLMAVALLLWPACSAENKPSGQNRDKEAAAVRQQRQMYQDKIQAKLRELDAEIDTLEAKMEEQKKLNRKKLEPQIAELDRKRESARQELEKLNNSSAEAWRDVKGGIDAAMDDLETACKQAASKFK